MLKKTAALYILIFTPYSSDQNLIILVKWIGVLTSVLFGTKVEAFFTARCFDSPLDRLFERLLASERIIRIMAVVSVAAVAVAVLYSTYGLFFHF